MITYTALTRFAELRLNTMCMNYERVYASPNEDAIHDLRVSIRRLLTQLKFLSFVFDQNQKINSEYALHYKKLKRYLKSLNTIRDFQIQLHYLENLPAERACPSKLIDMYMSHENENLITLGKDIDSWTLQKTRKKLRKLLRTHPVTDKELELKSYLYLNYLTQELHSAVQLCQTPDICGCHRLRIRLKEYRYHLEMLEQGFGIKQLLIGATKEWQDSLGTLQDLRVLLEQLNRDELVSDPEIDAFRSTVQNELQAHLDSVKDEVYAIRFETQLK